MAPKIEPAGVNFPDDCPTTRLLLDRIIEGSALCADEPDHEKLLLRADAGGFFPLLYQYMRATGHPTPVQFKKNWRVHNARLALYRAELGRALKTIEALSPVVVLKGAPLAHLLFGDETLRNTTDMDLLIDPTQIDAIVEALGAIGYYTTGSGEAKTWAYNQLLLVHKDYGTLIELHWRITFPHLKSPAIVDLFETTIPVAPDKGELTIRSLRPEMLLLQLCFHFHQHHGFFKGLLDIAGWIDRFEDTADLNEIRILARRYGISGVLQWGLHTLANFVGVRSVLYDPHTNLFAKSWARWTGAELERQLIGLASPNAVDRWWVRTSNGAKVAGILVDALSMSVADGAANRLRAVISPIVFGPHRIGRGVFGLLEDLRLVDRDALYERRILG